MTDLAALIAGNRKWVRLHRENKFQREAASRMARVLDELEAIIANRDEFRAAWNALGFEIDRLEAERDAALAVIENVREAVSHAMHPEQDQGRCGVCRAERILSSVPADVLRDRDAEKWNET